MGVALGSTDFDETRCVGWSWPKSSSREVSREFLPGKKFSGSFFPEIPGIFSFFRGTFRALKMVLENSFRNMYGRKMHEFSEFLGILGSFWEKRALRPFLVSGGPRPWDFYAIRYHHKSWRPSSPGMGLSSCKNLPVGKSWKINNNPGSFQNSGTIGFLALLDHPSWFYVSNEGFLCTKKLFRTYCLL